jgi:hypothetical protein
VSTGLLEQRDARLAPERLPKSSGEFVAAAITGAHAACAML